MGMAPRSIELSCGTQLGERLRLHTFAHTILENVANVNDRTDRLAVDLLSALYPSWSSWIVQKGPNLKATRPRAPDRARAPGDRGTRRTRPRRRAESRPAGPW